MIRHTRPAADETVKEYLVISFSVSALDVFEALVVISAAIGMFSDPHEYHPFDNV